MLYPLFAMVILTFAVAIVAVRARFHSVRAKEVPISYFRDMQEKSSITVPERIQITTRCFNNQFEVPVMFYAAGVSAMALGVETTLTIVTAWLFVISRCVHAWIHLTYNHILHRMRAFWVAMLWVLLLWLELLAARLF